MGSEEQFPRRSSAAIRIVIPVASSGSLKKCLHALLESSIRSEFEVVVVDNAVGNGLVGTLLPAEVKIVKSATPRNAGAARNRGAEEFAGDVLVFLDSDVIVEQKAIEELVAPIRDGRAEGTVGNYSEDVKGLAFCAAYKQLYVHHAYSRRQGYLQDEFWTALGAIRNQVFCDLRGFSIAFVGATGEDTELGHRLSRDGYRILAVPDAQGKHLKTFTLSALIRNDLRKGLSAFDLMLSNGRSVTNNRHSTHRDIGAVITAYAVFIAVVLSIWFVPWPLAAATSCYVLSRSDLLKVYRRQGAGCLLKSMPLMYLLDLVRGVCIALGLLRFFDKGMHSLLHRVRFSHREFPAR